MKILVLDATNKSLIAAMSASATTTNPEFVVSYADTDSSTFTEASTDGALNGTTNATLVSAPSSGVKRVIKSITIYNKDSASVTVYLKLLNNVTERIIEKIALAAGEVWHSDSQAGGGGTGRPSGETTQVQFNDGGVFAGDSGLVFNKTTDTLSTGTIVLSGQLQGPATLTIDPAAVGDNTGLVVIKGNLQVDGTTTTVNSTTMSVADLNITLASGAANAAAANGAGLTIAGPTTPATILYANSDDSFNINKSLRITSTQSSTSSTTGAFTVTGGVGIGNNLYIGGNIVPGTNGTQDLGTSSLRWNTIYTSDLSLNNGIGDWTIVEGSDDLFIYNNKRGKVYKFKLEEVDPSLAVAKREANHAT